MRITVHPGWLWPLGIVAGVVLAARQTTHYARRRYRDRTRSAAQLAMQAAFRAADVFWQQLDSTHKDAWRAWRAWDPLHGYPLFMRCNIPLARSGDPLLEEPPDDPPWD